jgi:hypothetical protein
LSDEVRLNGPAEEVGVEHKSIDESSITEGLSNGKLVIGDSANGD